MDTDIATVYPWKLCELHATSADDIIEAVNFAQEHNIRLVIRNTGHEYVQFFSAP
jgi:FAD/FMN-containing dehydrogenase